MLKGKPRYECRRKILGVGINDSDVCVVSDKLQMPSYYTWTHMMMRCYSKSYRREFPSYEGCFVCEEWKLFSHFKEWFDANYKDGYCLDKDILVKGNKEYAPEKCCFVPNEINALLIRHEKGRGKLPIGVTKKGQKYAARLNIRSSSKWLGTYDTILSAFNAYKEAKESYLKEMATRYYDDGKISKKIRDALFNYRVEITD